ncbi:MAG: hypothetical protein ACI85F_002935 [Bacteroidia bacterium]|jgi:hypothetical protein
MSTAVDSGFETEARAVGNQLPRMWETETVLAQYDISMEMRQLRNSHHLTQWYGYARQQIIRAYLVSVHGTDEHDQEGHVGSPDETGTWS